MENKWYKKISSWLIILYFILIISLIIVFGTIMVKAKLYPNKIPDFMGYKPLIILSDLIEKDIHSGDLVVVKIVDNKNLKEQDVIAYRDSENTATLHKIIEVKNDNGVRKYITNKNNETTIKNENIEGVFLFKISGMGDVLMFLQKPISLLIICAIIITIGTSLTIYFDKKNKVSISKEDLEEFQKFKEQQEEQEEII